MTRSDWSTADKLGWREAARWWFLARGVKANLAEDLTQEAILRLLRCQQRGQPLTRAYLHRVCQSVLYDHLRQCAREPNCQPLETCRGVAVVEMGFQQAEDRAFLEQALGQLRPLERAIVEMHHLEEQTFETIAATLGIPVERAKSCGCTVAELPYREIPPLNGFPVEVQVSTWGLPLGYQEKVVGLTVSSEGVSWQEVAIIRLEVVN